MGILLRRLESLRCPISTRAMLVCTAWLMGDMPGHGAPRSNRNLPELTAGEIAVLEKPREARRLAVKVWKDGPQTDFPEIATHPDRLDSWLALGGMTASLASRQSPATLLSSLARRGVHHNECVSSEYWMLSQFSIAYWLQLRSVNQQEFSNADHASASIRKALWAIQDLMSRLTSDRSYAADMVWGHSEWLLHQAKPSFLTSRQPSKEFGRIPLSELRREFSECRDWSGLLCSKNYQRDLSLDSEMIEQTLKTVSECLESWTPEGKDYLLTEFLLVVRDRERYYYGGDPQPRAIQVIGQRPDTQLPEDERVGKIVVTLSQGHREIWDASPFCSRPKIYSPNVSWVKNVKPGDTPATAQHHLRLMTNGKAYDFKPKGGFIRDFESSYSGISILSTDAAGGIWLERFSPEKQEATECYSLLEPPPEPFPNWASPFRQSWKR